MKETVEKKSGNGFTGAKSSQDRFLTQMIKERRKIEVFLVNGSRLKGEIVSYDQFAIVVKGATTEKVYKHAVSTIQPIKGFNLEGTAETIYEPTRTPAKIEVRKRRLPKVNGG